MYFDKHVSGEHRRRFGQRLRHTVRGWLSWTRANMPVYFVSNLYLLLPLVVPQAVWYICQRLPARPQMFGPQAPMLNSNFRQSEVRLCHECVVWIALHPDELTNLLYAASAY